MSHSSGVRFWSTFLYLSMVASTGLLASTGYAQVDEVGQVAGPPFRDLNSYFPFEVPPNLDAWQRRRAELKKHVRVSLGLWPYPKRNPLNAVIHGAIDQGDYTVEKVYFESLPGFLVTGNLYRPKNAVGKIPGIISPHGHFPEGRFGAQGDEAIAQSLESGSESFRSNAMNNIQTRCANLARMGCVVFDYDMIGYADSQQISSDVAHRFSQQTPERNGPHRWGLFSPYAELHLQNVMGLQAWNSIRALDFLEELPEVDPSRIGVTGASGGGTQTFVVCALDDRPAAAFPAVMVSTAMQGGCTCENCCYFRVGTGNVELAAMFAPKPLGLTSANDWTKEMETKGFPELKQLYAMYGKQDDVQLTSRTEFGHNYNQVSREAMYRWFKRHLKFDGEPVEAETEFLRPHQLTVFDRSHPRPPGGTNFIQNLLVGLASPQMRIAAWKTESSIRQALNDPGMLPRAQEMYGTTNRSELFRKLHRDWETLPAEFQSAIRSTQIETTGLESQVGTFVDVVMNAAHFSNGDAQATIAEPANFELAGIEARRWNIGTANGLPPSSILELSADAPTNLLLITEDGTSNLDAENTLRPWIERYLNSMNVLIFENGWMEKADWKQTRRVNNPREALAYTVGYNAPQLARRAQAWLIATTLGPRSDGASEKNTFVVSLDGAAPEVILNARELGKRNQIGGLVINTHGFRFHQITDIRDPNLLPGALKYGDVPGLLSLAAPLPMLLIGEDEISVQAVVKAYERAGAVENLTLVKSMPTGKSESNMILAWIQEQQSKEIDGL